MSRELEVLEKLERKLPLDESDKDVVYKAIPFEYGKYTLTLMHKIMLLPNGVEILKSLDKSKLQEAINKSIQIDDSLKACVSLSPLEFLVTLINDKDVYGGLYASYEDIIAAAIDYGANPNYALHLVGPCEYDNPSFHEMLQGVATAHQAQVNSTAPDSVLQETALAGEMAGSSPATLGFMQ